MGVYHWVFVIKLCAFGEEPLLECQCSIQYSYLTSARVPYPLVNDKIKPLWCLLNHATWERGSDPCLSSDYPRVCPLIWSASIFSEGSDLTWLESSLEEVGGKIDLLKVSNSLHQSLLLGSEEFELTSVWAFHLLVHNLGEGKEFEHFFLLSLGVEEVLDIILVGHLLFLELLLLLNR